MVTKKHLLGGPGMCFLNQRQIAVASTVDRSVAQDHGGAEAAELSGQRFVRFSVVSNGCGSRPKVPFWG